jgi:hypothetical protein
MNKKPKAAKEPKELGTVVDLAERMMTKLEKTDCLYRYGDQIVRVSEGKVKPMRKDDIAWIVRREFETLSETNVSAVSNDIIHTPDSKLKRIDTFTTKPVFVQNTGVHTLELITAPGFANNIYYEPDEALRGVEFLTDADLPKARASLDRLKEPLFDFPFDPMDKIEGNKAAYLSMMLTLILRPAIDGVTPCFFMRGNGPSLGKGLLNEMASLIVFGRRASLVSNPKTDTEWKTRLDSILMEGKQFVVIDNVVGKLDSQEFASVLTSRTRDCRRLHSSDSTTAPVNTVFAVNGNFVDLDDDITERSVMILLKHKDARSRNMEDFEIQKTYGESPDTFVGGKRRVQFLQDLINIVCAWKNAGSHRRQKITMSKYGAWEGIVGGILDYVWPESKFLSGNKDARAEANSEEQETIEFIEALRRAFPNCDIHPIVVTDIRQAIKDSDLCDSLPDALKTGTNDTYFANRLGKWMKAKLLFPQS